MTTPPALLPSDYLSSNTTTPVETVDASIHAPSNTMVKAKLFLDVPERRPSPDGNAAAIKSAPLVIMLRHITRRA
ncbi:hypothetical protein RIR_jg38271.t1 [Rhizophagus irregularis DAOM 181602=DAOM 197198]|nr:hypothetical protein RIR_jg38271.t1 [Rhizophagus irregularis DAOM 181602=DAOM 197198]